MWRSAMKWRERPGDLGFHTLIDLGSLVPRALSAWWNVFLIDDRMRPSQTKKLRLGRLNRTALKEQNGSI